MNVPMNAYALHRGPARCALDLGDGSERGEYVNQDYIINVLGRPHRAVNVMYCYYPLDKGWPARSSTLPQQEAVGYAWDYAYDDYYPYNTNGEPFASMRDIRRHGQDVVLTMTIDCGVSDAQLVSIAQDLRPFGRLQLRINHEATGSWFAFTKRYSYQQIADFFVRFHHIIKEHAPNIQTILCIGSGEIFPDGRMKYEDEFAEAIKAADIWSSDVYLSLHWGWPYDIAEPGGNSHVRKNNKDIIRGLNFELTRFKARGDGFDKPFVLSETNADGDVNGPLEQAEQVKDFYDRVPEELPGLTGITFYQFRDRGRLGLEIQDPNNENVGIAQPVMEVYKEIIQRDYYAPTLTLSPEAVIFPLKLRWGGSEDADGLSIPLHFEKRPVFCEMTFEDEQDAGSLNLMIEVNGKWFYKKPGVKTIDLMPAFFSVSPQTVSVNIFTPPPDGINDSSQGGDWAINYYATVNTLPSFRIRYAPVVEGEMV